MADISDNTKEDHTHADFSQTVDVLVGPEKKVFTVPKHYLTSRSKFVKAACSSTHSAGDAITLPTDDPVIFNMYLSCIYLNTASREGVEENSELAISLVETWILANKLGDLRAANIAMDSLCAFTVDAAPMQRIVNLCYKKAAAGSVLRRYCVDYIFSLYSATAFLESSHAYPEEFVRDLGLAWMTLRAQAEGHIYSIDELLLSDHPRYRPHDYHLYNGTSDGSDSDMSTPMDEE